MCQVTFVTWTWGVCFILSTWPLCLLLDGRPELGEARCPCHTWAPLPCSTVTRWGPGLPWTLSPARPGPGDDPQGKVPESSCHPRRTTGQDVMTPQIFLTSLEHDGERSVPWAPHPHPCLTPSRKAVLSLGLLEADAEIDEDEPANKHGITEGTSGLWLMVSFQIAFILQMFEFRLKTEPYSSGLSWMPLSDVLIGNFRTK